MNLSHLRPAAGSKRKRTRIGRGHGSGLVKTGGEGGKGQTVRSGGGKGPNFEGGQTPWSRRLPQRRGVSQKSRPTKMFRTEYVVINLHDLAQWDAAQAVTPDSLLENGYVRTLKDGVKILAAGDAPQGLTFKDVAFSAAAKSKLEAAGATFQE